MLNQIHFASQYLATTGKSFLEQKPDDSHTNIGFDRDSYSFETWKLNKNGLTLQFDVLHFQLRWSTGESFNLDGKTHLKVKEWLKFTSKKLGFEKTYNFDLHYDLPFTWDDSFEFRLLDNSYLNEQIQLRNLAQNALNIFLKSKQLKSEIRIWPHHFDTGAFVKIKGTNKSVGLGMAIPDSLLQDYYFYISGYNGNDGIDTTEFGKLSCGEWKNQGFKGAVLQTSNTNIDMAVQFFNEAFSYYIKPTL